MSLQWGRALYLKGGSPVNNWKVGSIMRRLFFFICLELCLYFLCIGVGRAEIAPMSSKEEFEKSVRIESSSVGGENVSRSYYNQHLLEEIVTRGDISCPPEKRKRVWEDLGTRWQCREFAGDTLCRQISVYKRGLNRSGDVKGKRFSDIFGPRYIFDKGWEYGDKKVLCRIIGEGHYLQILVISQASGVITQEIVLADPACDIERVSLLRDAFNGKKLLIIPIFRRSAAGGPLYLADIDSAKVECLSSRDVRELFVSPLRRYFVFCDTGADPGEGITVFDAGTGKNIYSRFFGGSSVKSVTWSPRELYVMIVIASGDGRMRLLRINTAKGDGEEFCDGAVAISPSPSGTRALFARAGQEFSSLRARSIDRQKKMITFQDPSGHVIEKEPSPDSCTLSVVDLAKKTGAVIGGACWPDLLNARWSDHESSVVFFDIDGIYRIEPGKKAKSTKKIAGPCEYELELPADALQPLGGDSFFLCQDKTVHYLKGTAKHDALVHNVSSFATNDNCTLMAYLTGEPDHLNLYIYDLRAASISS